MIEKTKELIKKDDFESFKKIYDNYPFNAHHKIELYKYAFFEQKENFIDYVYKKASLNKKELEDIFIESINKGLSIKHLKYLNGFDDLSLIGKFDKKIDVFIKNQKEELLINFYEKYPLTTLMNVKKFIFHAFKNDKDKFIEKITENKFNVEVVFYLGLCSIKFNKKELFNVVLENQIKSDLDITNKLKSYSENFIKKNQYFKMGIKREEIEEFIEQKIVEGFAMLLEATLEKKEVQVDKVVKNKLKI